MFTGIIEEVGKIESVYKRAKSLQITISGNRIFEDMHVGDSIAVNGVCLTVTSFQNKHFVADVMPESVKMSTLATCKAGMNVNLERAMAATGRFGGHMVAGHVDGTGQIVDIQQIDQSFIFTIKASPTILEYIIYKGSITIDGASLTVSKKENTFFQVSIIPHTISETILSNMHKGTFVNLETDIVGRYIKHFLRSDTQKDTSKTTVTKALLCENGFI